MAVQNDSISEMQSRKFQAWGIYRFPGMTCAYLPKLSYIHSHTPVSYISLLAKIFSELVQGCDCTTVTRLKVASVTSHVQILTSLILWCSKNFCKCIQVGKNNMLLDKDMSGTRYSGSWYWECGAKEWWEDHYKGML